MAGESATDSVGATITCDRADGVVTVTIDRPAKKNALTYAHFRRLAEIFDEVAHEVDDRVLVIRGSGDAFCSGADLTDTGDRPMSGFGPLDGVQWMREINDAAIALHRVPKPTIAAVNGVAAGAGCNLALQCDVVFAARSARFSQIFVRRGLNLDFGGTWLLPRLVGMQRAKDLAFRGAMLSADEALEIGLVLDVVDDDALDARVGDYAAELASLPPVPLMLMKHGLNRSFEWDMAAALDYEAHSQATCFGTEDIVEAMMAFVQKRPGSYKGR